LVHRYERTMRWLSLLLVLGCDKGSATGAQLDPARERDADVSYAAVDAGAGSAAGPCAASRIQDSVVVYTLSLDALCDMLERAGAMPCPTSRLVQLQSLSCAVGESQLLIRQCDTDILDRRDARYAYRWLFDRSGTLMGAQVSGTLACGQGAYVSANWPDCHDDVSTNCEICTGEHAGTCPADVLAAFPDKPCKVAPSASCECSNDAGPIADLPRAGSACDPSCACANGGFCLAACECAADGLYHWKVACAE
jgi:hypothetical protein